MTKKYEMKICPKQRRDADEDLDLGLEKKRAGKKPQTTNYWIVAPSADMLTSNSASLYCFT